MKFDSCCRMKMNLSVTIKCWCMRLWIINKHWGISGCSHTLCIAVWSTEAAVRGEMNISAACMKNFSLCDSLSENTKCLQDIILTTVIHSEMHLRLYEIYFLLSTNTCRVPNTSCGPVVRRTDYILIPRVKADFWWGGVSWICLCAFVLSC